MLLVAGLGSCLDIRNHKHGLLEGSGVVISGVTSKVTIIYPFLGDL